MRKMIRNSLIGATASLALALPVALPAAMPGSVPVAAAAGQNMSEGAHGAEVSAVQVLLNRHDAGLEVDGHFGPKTTAAVVAFQKTQGLEADGIVGPSTAAALAPKLRVGDTGPQVQAAQLVLQSHDDALAVDGVFGDKTAAATTSFQKAQGLEADGIIGPKTWAALLGIEAESGDDTTPPEGVDTSSPDAFIASIAPLAQEGQRRHGVPASVAMAQAIIESGWGTSSLTTEGNAFFGIKCNDSSEYANGCLIKETKEFENGRWITIRDGFQTYPDAQSSFLDHGDFLAQREHYAPAFNHQDDPDQFIREIHKGGYATAPDYADKIINLMQEYDLYQYNL